MTSGAGAPTPPPRAPASESLAPSDPDLGPVDPGANPCADFARFACGPARKASGRPVRPNDVVAGRRPALERFMTEVAAGQHADPAHGTPLLREFYLRCTDHAARTAGTTELRAALADISGAQTLTDLARRLGQFRSGGARLLIDLTPEKPQGGRAGPVAARVGVTGPWLPRRLYAPAHDLVAAYRRHWERLATLSGTVSAAEVEAAARVDAWLAGPVRGGFASGRHAVTGGELGRARFPWPAYLSGLDPPVPGPFVAHASGALARVDELARLPLADLKGYARVMLIERWAEFLDEAFLAEELRFHEGREPGGAGEAARLPAACASLAARDLHPLLADAYLSGLPDHRAEEVARRIFDRLRTRLDRRLRRADWVDETTRERARRRLRDVDLIFIGGMDRSRESAPAAPPGSFLDLYRRARQRDAQKTLALVGRPWTDEPLTPTLTPGEYFSRPNRVWVSPEIVRPPYLRDGDFNALSYGALGTVMGHELAHAIPPALQASPGGGPRAGPDPTPPNAAGAALSARLACLEDRIESMPAPDTAVDSRRSLGESWADRLGVDLALEVMDDEAATAVTGARRSREAWQRDFFVAYAQTMCAFQADDAPEIDLLRDPHPPVRRRINSVVADAPEFARAFRCAPGTPMAPARRCSAW